ncbi:MAG TPA: metallophosphoesterase [Gemmatimonadaceae bacterium]|jgi:Icc-related predicted phosphoesterase|nr:metallophosphoesterase [Gemmatimonadaceae bacterium]
MSMIIRGLLVPILAAAAAAGHWHQAPITGVVFDDRNGNGVRDSGEPGIAGVAVSNQDTVVTTDAMGAYRITARGTGVIFVSTPDGYTARGTFWKPVSPGGVDFALSRAPRARELTFVHASDTHLSPASLARTERLRAVVDSLHPDLLLITGDLVRDALRVGEAEATSYYELFAKERSLFRVPVFTVPGNHENFGIERDTSHVSADNPLYGRAMYHKYFGPDYYSFTRGGVHFVGLNTVDIADKEYYGHVDSVQLAWLARDLALVAPATPVVTFDHIPFFSTFEGLGGYVATPPAPSLITVNGKTSYRHTVSNAGDVLSILRKHRHVLALGGHIHGTERIEYEISGVKTRFNQVSAVIAPPRGAGLQFISGVTLYRVKDGVIDAGQFIPLDPQR